jgi:tol-pal system protein YbgF
MLEQEPPRPLPGQATLSHESRARTGTGLRTLLALAVVLGGCTSVAEVTGTATQQDLVQLRADVTALQLNAQRLRSDVEKQSAQLGARAREQAQDKQRQSEELGRRIEALSTSVATLSARVDELGTKVESLGRRAATPPAAPAAPQSPKPLAAPQPSPPPAPAPPTSRSTTGTPQPQDLYQAAYLDFSKGSYDLAITGFREFLRRYPEQELAGNAQYWIGEAYWSLARTQASGGQSERATKALEQAIQEFRKVIANYPRGEKAPTALYKEALALIELKQPALAQARLEYLIDNFPQAEETPLARERLASLKSG